MNCSIVINTIRKVYSFRSQLIQSTLQLLKRFREKDSIISGTSLQLQFMP
jgi:hypothetical protein